MPGKAQRKRSSHVILKIARISSRALKRILDGHWKLTFFCCNFVIDRKAEHLIRSSEPENQARKDLFIYNEMRKEKIPDLEG